MTTKKQTGDDTGASDGFATRLDAAVEAARKPIVEPAPDHLVSAAFALGWQVAELYRPEQESKQKEAGKRRPGPNGRFEAEERAQLALPQRDTTYYAEAKRARTPLGPAVRIAPAGDVLHQPVRRLVADRDALPPVPWRSAR